MVEPPHQWPQALRDDAERMLREVAQAYQDGIGGLRTRYRKLDFKLEFDSDPAREWLQERLLDRLYPSRKLDRKMTPK